MRHLYSTLLAKRHAGCHSIPPLRLTSLLLPVYYFRQNCQSLHPSYLAPIAQEVHSYYIPVHPTYLFSLNDTDLIVFIVWIYHFIVASLLLIAVNQRLANVSNCIDGYARHKKAL